MSDRRFIVGALLLLVAALGLAACGSDTTTTVTETSPSASSSSSSETTTSAETATTGSGEASEESIAPPDAKAQAQIDKIASGVTNEQKQTDASGSDAVAGGENGVPALSFAQAKSGLSRARYCGNYIVAGPNTSCSFALNVAYDFYANGRPRSFISYSPVTGQAYHVYCRGKHPTVCVAGNSASIYIG
jgi:hypothetical protein